MLFRKPTVSLTLPNVIAAVAHRRHATFREAPVAGLRALRKDVVKAGDAGSVMPNQPVSRCEMYSMLPEGNVFPGAGGHLRLRKINM